MSVDAESAVTPDLDLDVIKAALDEAFSEAADGPGHSEGGWNPLIDSMTAVEIVVVVEDYVTWKVNAHELVKPGGYASKEQAVADVLARVRRKAAKTTRAGSNR